MASTLEPPVSACSANITTNASGTDDMDMPFGSLCSNMTSDLSTLTLGQPLLETDFTLSLIYICVVGVALTVGTVGNVLILIVTFTSRSINRMGQSFIVNLALADLCVVAIADPMCILGVMKGERWFDDKETLCTAVASLCLTACFCAFMNLSMLTFNRYMFVCHNKTYYKVFKKPVNIALCVACWVIAFCCEMPSFLGWGGHYFDKKNHQCIWDRTTSFSYTLFVTAVLIMGPLMLMAIGYILMFKKIWQSKLEIFILNIYDPFRMQRVWKEAVKTSKTLVVIFFAFVVCWTPYAIVTVIDVHDRLSMEVHLFVTLLAHMHSSLNCVIFCTMNRKFREAILKILCCSSTRRAVDDVKGTASGDAKTTTTSSSLDRSESNEKPVLKGVITRQDAKDSFDRF